MKRELTSHKISGLNESIQIQVLDEPGIGGACHRYRICVPMLDPVEHHVAENSRRARTYCDINFQQGSIAEAGINGISNEALLAVVEDRLAGFQSGPYACKENDLALHHVQVAMTILRNRTKERLARGVEGTSQK